MEVVIITIFAGLAACVVVQYLSYVLNWQRDKEARAILFTFGATVLITAPYVANFIVG